MEELLKLLVREVSDLRNGLDGVMDELRLLREAVDRLREVNESGGKRRVRGISGAVGKVRDYDGLSEGEREVVRLFVEWLVGKERELSLRYLEGDTEGVDYRTNRVYLRGITLDEFLYRVIVGEARQVVLKLLGEVGLLKYRVDERGRYQYCISVRMVLFRKEEGADGKVYKRKLSVVCSRYVVDWGRVLELYERMKKEKKRVGDLERKVRAMEAVDEVGSEVLVSPPSVEDDLPF
jgi:hypothetical protein